MELYTTPFALALTTLKRNIGLVDAPESLANPDIANAVMAGAIQAFEYSYELGVRLIRRKLKDISESPQAVEALEYRALMRLAADKGLIDDPLRWDQFRHLRNATSHTYHEHKAREVFADIPVFIDSATRLLARLDEYVA